MRQRPVKFNLKHIAAAVFLVCAAAAPAANFKTLASWGKVVSPGGVYAQYKMTVNGLPLRVYITEIWGLTPDYL